ncbi:eukaryotic translation initiation factor 2D [Hyposmocoma kahamanoa]|uniref:eukaryotic translation initiation factor 2D n=1 Tax=Hyposmocoma kahamanoa TaxID=1477025 RepID=UPI000E6D886B|nr:eukaryotic translation initiation factor 2D [Hyposmocoma kahamanoa]
MQVTLVSNLEAYGFVLPSLSTACQRAVGAACGVTRAPGARHDQLMLQGDQTRFVTKLLVEKYGLPKKYVEGADKALNKKK